MPLCHRGVNSQSPSRTDPPSNSHYASKHRNSWGAYLLSSRLASMAKPNKLADLKLVNKYYPSTGITNYSYRSPKLDTTFQCDRPVGRSSVGSDASVPGMVDDGESIIFTDEDDQSFYHISGAELWDKFWEDPFWEANAEEAKQEADGIKQNNNANRHASYPALIPSPDESFPKDRYFLERCEGEVRVAGTESSITCTWPLAVAEPPTSPRPTTPKVSYSLFPRQTPTPPAVLNLSPRRARDTPQPTALWSTPGNNDSTVSLTSLGRSARVLKGRSDTSHPKGRSSWSLSSLVIPSIVSPSTATVESSSRRNSSRRDSSQSINQRQRFPIRVSRTRSDTLMSHSSTISAPQPIIISSPLYDVSVPKKPPRQPPRPPRSPPGFSGRYSQLETHKIPPALQLQRCITATDIPSHHHHQRQSRSSSHSHAAQTNPTTPTMPQALELPLPVSVFELDSDSDEEGASFARRIARSFTSQKRARSASAAPRSRKGQEVAKQQLRCAQVETLAASSSSVEDAEAHGTREDDSRQVPRLRKQKSEVFGKVFWNRR